VRWLVAAPGPGFSVFDVYAGWVEGLKANGQTVLEFPMGDLLTFYEAAHIERDGEYVKAVSTEQAKQLAADRLAGALYKVAPDVLLLVSGFFVTPAILDLARARGTRVVLLHTESPYEDDRQLRLAPHADLNLINDPTNLAQFEAVAPTVYAPHAYRESLHYSKGEPREVDFAFVGTGYPSRVEFFEQFDFSGLNVRLAGNWMRLPEWHPLRAYVAHDIDECFDNDDAAGLYRQTKVGLNLYRREANAEHLLAGWAMGPREVEMAACGLFFLRDPRPESDEVFPMLPTFQGGEEASELVRWWLAHDTEREKCAALAAEAIQDRTFTAHAAKLLRLFG
jgi:spore maturation protein CgeB